VRVAPVTKQRVGSQSYHFLDDLVPYAELVEDLDRARMTPHQRHVGAFDTDSETLTRAADTSSPIEAPT
jgi:hypothetical protein